MEEEKGIMLFWRNVDWMVEVNSLAAIKLAVMMSSMTEKENPEIYLSPRVKKQIREKCGISTSTFSTVLGELSKRHVIAPMVDADGKRENGMYVVNPAFFWQGSFEGRKAAMEKYKSYFE